MSAPVQFVASSDPMFTAVFEDAIQMAGFFSSIRKTLKKATKTAKRVVKKATPVILPFIPGVAEIAAAAVAGAQILQSGPEGAAHIEGGQPLVVPRQGLTTSVRDQLPVLGSDVARNSIPFSSTLAERSTVHASRPVPWKTIAILAGGLVVLVVLTKRSRR